MTQENQQAANEPTLSANPRLSELFDFIQVDEGVRVLPVTVKQAPDDTRLLVAISGNAEVSNVIMAQLMSKIDELHDLSDINEQREAVNRDKPETEIITP